jgi:hypothetical protein
LSMAPRDQPSHSNEVYWRMSQTTIARGATVPSMKESAF